MNGVNLHHGQRASENRIPETPVNIANGFLFHMAPRLDVPCGF